MFHYTIKTNKSISEAIKTLKENLKKEKFGVLWEFDLAAKLREKGIDFQKNYFILEVCNPQEANRVLQKEKLAGYFLPCKIVLFEDNEGTKIGLPKPSSIIGLLDNPDLLEIAQNVEERLVAAINDSK